MLLQKLIRKIVRGLSPSTRRNASGCSVAIPCWFMRNFAATRWKMIIFGEKQLRFGWSLSYAAEQYVETSNFNYGWEFEFCFFYSSSIGNSRLLSLFTCG